MMGRKFVTCCALHSLWMNPANDGKRTFGLDCVAFFACLFAGDIRIHSLLGRFDVAEGKEWVKEELEIETYSKARNQLFSASD